MALMFVYIIKPVPRYTRVNLNSFDIKCEMIL